MEEGSGVQPLPTRPRDGGHEGDARLDRNRVRRKLHEVRRKKDLYQETESPEQIKREIEIMRETQDPWRPRQT